MSEYNNRFNENKINGSNSYADSEQNDKPQDTKINQSDLYAPYNLHQSGNIKENTPQQNVNQQGPDYNNIPQNGNSFSSLNGQQHYSQNNAYGYTYNRPPYVQNNQNNMYGGYSQPQQYNAPYYNQQYPIYNFQKRQNGFAIASMVLGICSVLGLCCLWFVTMFTSIAGLVLGIVSIKRNEGGKGMAIAGIILSSAGILFSILAMIIFIFNILNGEHLTGLNNFY